MDALVGLLNAMNSKLDIIKDKLDVIYKEMLGLSDQFVYKGELTRMAGVFGQTNVVYKNYDYNITTYGLSKGHRLFVEKYEQTIMEYISDIETAFNNIKRFYDPVTVSYVSICAKVDYEFSVIVDKEHAHIKHKLEEYLDYFKKALWLDPNNLGEQAANCRKEIERWRRLQSLFQLCLPDGTCKFRYNKFYELKPLPLDSTIFSKEELTVIENLYRLGLLTKEDQKIKYNYESSIPCQQFCKMELKPYQYNDRCRAIFDRLRSEGYVNPGVNGYVEAGGGSEGNFFRLLEVREKTVPEEYKDHFIRLMLFLSANQAATESVKFLNQVLLAKKFLTS